MEHIENNTTQTQISSGRHFRKGDIIGALVIGEVIAWLLFLMVSVNAHELPLPSGLASAVSSPVVALALAIVLPLLSAAGLFVAYIMSSAVSILYRIGKYALVGALNTFIDLGVLNAFILLTGESDGLAFLVFKGLGFTAAVINSYFWNRYWTFESSDTEKRKEFVQFIIVSLGGLIVNVGTAWIIVGVVGPQGDIAPQVWANIAALSATAASLVWNFIGYKFWVFDKNN